MSEIRFRLSGAGKDLIPPVEPVTPGRGSQKFTEGEPPRQPEEIKTREGEKRRTWVPDKGVGYTRTGEKAGSWQMLTEAEADELGVTWGE